MPIEEEPVLEAATPKEEAKPAIISETIAVSATEEGVLEKTTVSRINKSALDAERAGLVEKQAYCDQRKADFQVRIDEIDALLANFIV